MNAPTMIQNNISNILNPYSKGCGGCTGAGFPPNPVVTAGAPKPVLLPKPAAAGEPKLPELPNPPAEGAPNAVGLLCWLLNPPLFIPPAGVDPGGT
jgi:hypothetical protein